MVRPGAGPSPAPIPLQRGAEADYSAFNQRLGTADTGSLGGNPRSIDFEAEAPSAAEKTEEAESAAGNGVDEEAVSRRRRNTPVDGNGNRILRLVRREAEAEDLLDEKAVAEADIETSRVIRVVSPSDVQFQLTGAGQEEVVINTNEVSIYLSI